MPQTKQKTSAQTDKDAVFALRLEARRGKLKKRKKLRAEAEKLTSLKTAGLDPEYGYLAPGKTTRTGKADPRFSRKRGKDPATDLAIKKDQGARGDRKYRREIMRNVKSAEKDYSTKDTRTGKVKIFKGRADLVKTSPRFKKEPVKKATGTYSPKKKK